mgnify:CR=1 FL=1
MENLALLNAKCVKNGDVKVVSLYGYVDTVKDYNKCICNKEPVDTGRKIITYE